MTLPGLIVITGLSGSGKSTAARVLEDEGFYVVDNLPPLLLPRFLELSAAQAARGGRTAVVMDVRSLSFGRRDWDDVLEAVSAAGAVPEIWFFEAGEEELIRRFSETRRRHPLADGEGVPAAIRRERELVAAMRRRATAVFDTTGLNVHQLRRTVLRHVHAGEEGGSALSVCLQSFGYRYGIPLESDLIMDVRFLPNPHFVEELKPLTGLETEVREYVLAQPACREFLARFRELLQFLLPHYQKEGKRYLTLAVGCTGGRHRSVAVVEALRPLFTQPGIDLEIRHRDRGKGGAP